MPAIQQEYKNVAKKDTNLKMDQDNFLSAESCGGVELLAAKGEHFSFVIVKYLYK
jgi:V-type H+-transporting ATPase subunit E